MPSSSPEPAKPLAKRGMQQLLNQRAYGVRQRWRSVNYTLTLLFGASGELSRKPHGGELAGWLARSRAGY